MTLSSAPVGATIRSPVIVRHSLAAAVSVVALLFGSAAVAGDASDKQAATHGLWRGDNCKEISDARYRESYPNLGAFVLVNGQSNSQEVSHAIYQTIINIRHLRDEYTCEIDHYRGQQTWFDSSVIGLGIGAVAAAFFRSSVPAIGAVNIAGSAVSQFRGYYRPDMVGDAYIKSVKDARCISSQAEPLLTADPQNLWNAIATLRQAIVNVEVAQSQLGTTGPGDAKAGAALADAKSTSSDAATSALDAGYSALSALDAEATAYNIAPSVIDQAHDAIKDYIDNARRRTVVDINSVRSALNNDIKTAGASAGDTQAARSQLTTAIIGQAKAQASAKNAGVAGTPPPVPPPPRGSASDVAGNVPNRAAADQQPAPTTTAKPTGRAAVTQANGAVLDLIAKTRAALQQIPQPAFTLVNTQIKACTSDL